MEKLDWFRTNDSSSRKQEGQRYRITIAGDWAPIWTYEEIVKASPTAVYGDLLPILRESDFNIVNLEAVLGDKGAPVPKPGPCLKADLAASIASLKATPFHAVTLANNHAMDFGPESLQCTLHALDAGGILRVGAGMNASEVAAPLEIETEHFRYAIVNCGEGEACASYGGRPGVHRFDLAAQRAQIRVLKERNDLVFVIFHGGREHAAAPPPYVVEALRAFVDAGADAVVGHHPHVPQGVEIYRDAPIAYSTGNFVFRRGNEQYYLNTGYLVHLDIAEKKIVHVALTPYQMKAEGVTALTGDERRAFVEELQTLSGFLQDEEKLRQLWNAFFDVRGFDWLVKVLEAGVAELKGSPESGCVRWQHYFGMPAHRDFFENAFLRLKLGIGNDSPEWARTWVDRWESRKIGDQISPS